MRRDAKGCETRGRHWRRRGGREAPPRLPAGHSHDTPGQPLFQFRPAPQRVAVGGAPETLHEVCQQGNRYTLPRDDEKRDGLGW